MDRDPQNIRHSDEMQDIITAVPARLIRWGMILFSLVLIMIVSLSAIIHYPDIIKMALTIKNDRKTNAEIFGELIIPQSEIEKVSTGEDVLVKLKAYPFEQYGTIKARIESVTRTLDYGGNFSAAVAITSNTTSKNKSIQLQPGMLGEAEIVTQDATILQRISHSMFKAIKNK
jgi:HlyD family secretion protein